MEGALEGFFWGGLSLRVFGGLSLRVLEPLFKGFEVSLSGF